MNRDIVFSEADFELTEPPRILSREGTISILSGGLWRVGGVELKGKIRAQKTG